MALHQAVCYPCQKWEIFSSPKNGTVVGCEPLTPPPDVRQIASADAVTSDSLSHSFLFHHVRQEQVMLQRLSH
jgi:hypothetical protein